MAIIGNIPYFQTNPHHNCENLSVQRGWEIKKCRNVWNYQSRMIWSNNPTSNSNKSAPQTSPSHLSFADFWGLNSLSIGWETVSAAPVGPARTNWLDQRLMNAPAGMNATTNITNTIDESWWQQTYHGNPWNIRQLRKNGDIWLFHPLFVSSLRGFTTHGQGPRV